MARYEEDDRDLSLGIITDDRDCTDWSDEEDELTPRILPPHLLRDLDEEAEEGQGTDPEDDYIAWEDLAFNKRGVPPGHPPSRSGAWSSISWTSLYERGSDSSLSWADDELEKETTDKVDAHFRAIDDALYASEHYPHQSGPSAGHTNKEGRLLPQVELSAELKAECQVWREAFPHLRVVGDGLPIHPVPPGYSQSSSFHATSVPSDSSQQTSVLDASSLAEAQQDAAPPSRRRGPAQRAYGEDKAEGDNPSSTSGMMFSIGRRRKDPEEAASSELEQQKDNEEEGCEETYAVHGFYTAPDSEDGDSGNLLEGIGLNERFEAEPRVYFEEKIMTAIFRKVWSQLTDELHELVDLYGDRLVQDSMEMLSLSSRESSAAQQPSRYGSASLSALEHPQQQQRRSQQGGLSRQQQLLQQHQELQQQLQQSPRGISGIGSRQMQYLPGEDQNPRSLPNLSWRQVPSSAPSQREPSSRPMSSSHSSRQSVLLSRPRRGNSLKNDPGVNGAGTDSIMATPRSIKEEIEPTTPTKHYTRNNGKSQAPMPPRVRSQSGSPPELRKMRPPAGPLPPISLPPIQGISAAGSAILAAQPKLSSRSTTAASSTTKAEHLALTPRGTGITKTLSPPGPRGPLLMKPPPTAPPALTTSSHQGQSTADLRSFSVSGKKLKSLQPLAGSSSLQPGMASGEGRTSRTSLNGPAHWDARSSLPVNPAKHNKL